MNEIEDSDVTIIIPNCLPHEKVGCVLEHETVVDGHCSDVRSQVPAPFPTPRLRLIHHVVGNQGCGLALYK
jgi:hypothetical protein